MFSFFHFLKAALRNPRQVSTPFQTGEKVAGGLADIIPENPTLPVIELGVGAGAITDIILGRLSDPKIYTGFELDVHMYEYVCKRFPQAHFINSSAELFPNSLDGKKASAIISSLPWTLMPQTTVDTILDAIVNSLAPGAALATYITLHVIKTPPGKRVLSSLESRFSVIESRVIANNLPPVKVFIARN